MKGVKFSSAKVKGAHFENSFGLTQGQKEGGAFVSDKDPIAKKGALIEALIGKIVNARFF